MSYPLGWVSPADRTTEQTKAHEDAMGAMPQFSMQQEFAPLPKGGKIDLTERWADSKVVGDIGFVFERFHQLTGSCVGASFGNATVTLSPSGVKIDTSATVEI